MSDSRYPNDNNPYDDLLRRRYGPASEENKSQGESGRESTSYYRYGPFDAGEQRDSAKPQAGGEPLSTLDERDVEITVPEAVRPLVVQQEPGGMTGLGAAGAQAARPAKTHEPKRRSSWKSMFASFMVGVVVVGGLMFAADATNLFTGNAGLPAAGSEHAAAGAESTVTSNGGYNGSSVQNAALDIVRPGSIASIVNNSRAAVVKIETYAKVSRRSSTTSDDFFDFFFNNGSRGRSGQQGSGQSAVEQKVGEGSGFIFDSEGYILTNQHVIDGAETIKVYVEGFDEPFIAETLGDSVDLDLAAIKIKGDQPFANLKLGDVDELNVGDWVIAIGNPYGYDHTVTVGVLSAKERPISIRDGMVTRDYEHLLQTDASINPGNSGGPLLNLNGEVIGINTAVNASAQGIGFAIPTSTIYSVLDNLKNDQPIPKEPAPYVGVYLGDLTDEIASELGYTGTDGSVVMQVEVGGPASKAGVQAGDVITEVAGTKIKTTAEVQQTVAKQAVGSKITMKVFREGKTYEVVIIVGDRNAQ